MQIDDSGVALVALEQGALWPVWMGRPHPRTPNMVVEAQTSEEDAETYASRVLHRIARGGAGNGPLKLGMIATNGRSGALAFAARARIARALCAAMNAGGGGELVLVADGDVEDEARHALLALAGTLIDDLGAGSVNVRVRFSDAVRDSGVMPRVAKIDATADASTASA